MPSTTANLDAIKAGGWPYWATEDGSIVLVNADCLEVLPVLSGIDAVVTDPPYGIGFAAQPTKWQRRAGMTPEAWDDSAVDLSAVLEVAEVCAIWGGNNYSLPPSRGWICWTKPDAPPSMGACEFCWTSCDKNAAWISHSISATNRERVGHPTQKPLMVMERTIEYCGECDSVLDPFTGSGTTGVACVRLGRHFIGIEREPRYYQIAIDRIKKELNRMRLFEKPPSITQRELAI